MQGADAGAAHQLLQEYVQRALSSKIKGGDASEYNSFVKEFTALRRKVERDPSNTGLMMLANLINALRDCVSLLRERKHDAILSEVLGIKLWGAPPMVRSAVLDLVTNVVVANPAFAHTCLQLLVFSLLPPPGTPTPDTSRGSWKMAEDEVMVQQAVLAALMKIMTLVPAAPGGLLSLVVQHMPHKLRDRHTQCMFLSAVYAVAESPAGRPIRDSLLAACVEHLLTIDVDIKWEDIVDVPTGEEEEEASDEEQEDIFELEGMSELDINADPEALERFRQERGGWEGAVAVGSHAAQSDAAGGRAPVDETANKLDSMMDLTFAHLQRRLMEPNGLPLLWDAMLPIFERTILSTHRSKFSQFLIFYICCKHPDPCGRMFVEFLLARLKDDRQAPIMRSGCAAYLASFLARASFLHHTVVFYALVQLADFCHAYCAAHNSALQRSQSVGGNILLMAGGMAGGPDPSGHDSLTNKHQVLYASVQCILYVLCYHMETLLHPSQHSNLKGPTPPTPQAVASLVCTRVLPMLSHWLQPLNVCLPSVVTEFKHQVTTLKMANISSIAPPDVALQRAQRPLEMFFPFDPYLLKRSSRWLDLRTSYVRWRHGHAQAAHPHDDSSSDEEEAAKHGQGVGDEDDGMDEDLALDDSESSTSSSDDEDGSLRGASLASDAVLSRPKLHVLPKRGAGLPSQPQAVGPRYAGAKHMRQADMMGTSYDAMGTSYSPGHMAVMGMTPPNRSLMGTSPSVVVEYFQGGTSVSPMTMTPPTHHFEQHATRLAGLVRK